MKTLVIDSATEACSVALFDGDRVVADDWRMLGRGHAEQLVPMIGALPANGRADRIAVALGPGSFTGVRVGLAAARALAFAWKAELVGYATLDLVAAMARRDLGAESGESLAVAMTGGHGEWFVQSFSAASSSLLSLAPVTAASAITDTIVAGSQAEALVAARGSGRSLPLLPDARDFGLLPPQSLHGDVQPIYGRGPDAKLPPSAMPAASA